MCVRSRYKHTFEQNNWLNSTNWITNKKQNYEDAVSPMNPIQMDLRFRICVEIETNNNNQRKNKMKLSDYMISYY